MVPFVDLKAQYAELQAELDEAVLGCLRSGVYVLGSEVAAFEAEFSAYCECDHGVATNSGTSALHLALLAAGIGKGDEVITVPFTFVATLAAIDYAGARPVLVDIDPTTFTMDAKQIQSAITNRTRAIIPVHLYGQPVDMDPILEIARQHNLMVIEDACQAHGAIYRGRKAGSLGHVGCFSFYPGKNLGAFGEGGMAVTNDEALSRKMRMLRDWGQERKYHHTLKGFNYRMEAVQGAVLNVKLRHLEQWTGKRQARAAQYRHLLLDADVHLPFEREDARHVWHVYAIRSRQRDRLGAELLKRGIHTGIHYPIPIHLQEAWAHLGLPAGSFPQSETAAAEVLSLPMFAELSEGQVEQVAAAVKEVVGLRAASTIA